MGSSSVVDGELYRVVTLCVGNDFDLFGNPGNCAIAYSDAILVLTRHLILLPSKTFPVLYYSNDCPHRFIASRLVYFDKFPRRQSRAKSLKDICLLAHSSEISRRWISLNLKDFIMRRWGWHGVLMVRSMRKLLPYVYL
jgi:hypothetical protein